MQYAGRFFVGSASLDAQSLPWLTGRDTGGGGIGMDLRPFGRTGLMISPVTLGSMEFGSKVDEAEAAEVFGRALDAGVNAIDTANVYGSGRSEEVVGHLINRCATS